MKLDHYGYLSPNTVNNSEFENEGYLVPNLSQGNPEEKDGKLNSTNEINNTHSFHNDDCNISANIANLYKDLQDGE